MASLIKNQIIKHLSVFARNLKPEQISVEVLRGKGELKNIVLNEDVLSEKLELPPWLKIVRAECNRVTVKIPWTSLKSKPVQIYIDEIRVTIKMTSGLASNVKKSSSLNPGSYGFADKVVEGMSLYINSVEVDFESDMFGGSLLLSRLAVESKTPRFKNIDDLRMCRISDHVAHRVLFYKQITWQILRIEASALSDDSRPKIATGARNRINSPLRLITSAGKCRITIKKNNIDGSVLGGRIQIILDHILWVATLPQVRSAIAFYKHIMEIANSSSKISIDNPFLMQTKNFQDRPQKSPVPPIHRPIDENLVSRAFKQLDFTQSSYHLYVNRIELHLCDDSTNLNDYPSNWNINSGAMQVTLIRLTIDFYPNNLISNARADWARYHTPNNFTDFCEKELVKHFQRITANLDKNTRERFLRIWPQLTSQNVVIRIEDLAIQCVSEQTTKREALQVMFSSNAQARLSLPFVTTVFHLEFANYFFPASDKYEVPPNSMHLQVGPFNFLVDHRSIRWMIYVADSITNAFELSEGPVEVPYSDIRVELVMPKIIIPCTQLEEDSRLPKRLVVNMSTVSITNCPLNDDVMSVSGMFGKIFSGSIDFISEQKLVSEKLNLRNHVLETKQIAADLDSTQLLKHHFLITTSPIWVEADFGENSHGTIILSDISIAACLNVNVDYIQLAIQPQSSLNVIVDHFQLLQLMRLQQFISQLVDQLDDDRRFFAKISGKPPMDMPFGLFCLCDEVDVHLVLPHGPVPSPYDMPPNGVPSSDTSTSISSDLTEKGGLTTEITSDRNNAVSPNNLGFQPQSAIRELDSFPEYPLLSDLESSSSYTNLDRLETMSVATNLSDDESQFVLSESVLQEDDDIFSTAGVAIAEEAEVVDEAVEGIRIDKKRQRFMANQINVLDAKLANVNVALSSSNGISKIEGFASEIQISERKAQICGDIYNESGKIANSKKIVVKVDGYENAKVKFQVQAEATALKKGSIIKAQLKNLFLRLSDEIISHLGPFIQDNLQEEQPVTLEISLEDSKIEIIDPKKKNPLRIKLGNLSIFDGPILNGPTP